MDTPLREQLHSRLGSLKNERSSWFSHWQELSTYVLPRNGRYFVQDRNKGQRRNNNILDSSATRALTVLASGMMAGMTSPARPWFRLTTPDRELNDSDDVKRWLYEVTRQMLAVFAKSNTYRTMHGMYMELGLFGTSASVLMDDNTDMIRHHPLTIGEYMIAQDYRGRVCTLYREFEKPVSEVVKEFGYENCSTTVQNLYDRGQLDSWVPIVHAIEPREDRDVTKLDAKNKPWRSVYYEAGATNDKILSESGFSEFPALVPRWNVIGGDIYGHSPCMDALGDIKQLQHQQLRKAQAIDLMVNPPMIFPSGMKNREIDLLPRGITFADTAVTGNGAKTAFEVNINLQYLLSDIQDVRGRINSTLYADLFLMLATNNIDRMTATEVAERHEEKLLMLGPVLERLHNEMLDPLIELVFTRLVKSGKLPPPPPELQGVDLKVEFVSTLAQAQKSVATNGIDRFVGNLGAVAQAKPGVLDKFNEDEWADMYADMMGVPPQLIVADKDVAFVRQQRAQAQQAAQQAQMANVQSQTAANLAKASSDAVDPTAAVMGYT